LYWLMLCQVIVSLAVITRPLNADISVSIERIS